MGIIMDDLFDNHFGKSVRVFLMFTDNLINAKWLLQRVSASNFVVLNTDNFAEISTE